MAEIKMRGSIVRRRHGVLWYRLHVPEKLRPLLGWEIKKTLTTTDWAEARAKAPAVALWAQQKLAEARSKLDQQVQERWREDDLDALHDAYEQSLSPAWRAWEYALRYDGIRLGEEPDKWKHPFGHTPLARLLGISRALDAEKAVESIVAGGPALIEQVATAVTLSALFNAWADERKPPAKTRTEWRRTIERFIRFLDHDRAEDVSRKDVIRWKDQLLANGNSAKTTADRVSTVRTIFNHAILNERVERRDNPAQGVRVAARGDAGESRRGFTEDEARRVLKAARAAPPEMRWLLWLLATTGARVGEIAQLAVSDVRWDDGGGQWFVNIEPGDGKRVKTDRPRVVPLHNEVLEEGLLDYLNALPQDGRVFPSIPADKFGSYGGTATKRVSRFVRSLGLVDRRLAPAHSFRHLMVTRLRAAGVRQEISEAIVGHASRRTVHDRYGSGFPLKVLRREGVDLLPPSFAY